MKLINFYPFPRIVFFCFLISFQFSLFSQSSSSCTVHVSKEPRATQVLIRPAKVQQTTFSYLTKWADPQNSSLSDDKKSSLRLQAFKHSNTLTFSNFNANIPFGADIHGIEVFVEGQSTIFTSIAEINVLLHSKNKTILSQNKANTATLQKPWAPVQDSKDKKWRYGGQTDKWETSFSSTDINREDFSFDIQVRNTTASEITAFIDDVSIIVHYTPLYSFCKDSCVVFYVDRGLSGHSYQWHVPENFMIKSRENTNTINLTGGNALFGNYTICADVLDYNGNILESCCRSFNYSDCSTNGVKGQLWNDSNVNHTKDSNEPVLQGIKVSLYSAAGNKLKEDTTDVFGRYEFTALPSGSYYVIASQITQKLFVLNNPAVPQNINSDVTNDFGIGSTSLLVLQNSVILENIDFGYAPATTIGDLVWHDQNANGIKEISESGMQNIRIFLLDQLQIKVDSTLTGVDGKYIFDNIPANTYALQFVIPAGYFPTCRLNGNMPGNSKIDETGITSFYSFTSGSPADSIDAGFVAFGSVKGLMFDDLNVNGYYDSGENLLSQKTVELSGMTTCGQSVQASIQTNVNGEYHFPSVKPGNYSLKFNLDQGFIPSLFPVENVWSNKMTSDSLISNLQLGSGQTLVGQNAGVYRRAEISGRVWEDKNVNSLQESDEVGIKEIAIILRGTDALSQSVELTTTTDTDGRYSFSDLIPGNYNLEMTAGNNFTFSPFRIEQDTTVDNNSNNGLTEDITLLSGKNYKSVDFGIFYFSSLGDKVWHDLNGNGIQETDEPGIEGVGLTLLGTTVMGNVVQEVQVSDLSGEFKFRNLIAGEYVLTITDNKGFEYTAFRAGNDDSFDSDISENGNSATINVFSNQQIQTIDIGLYKKVALQGSVWEDMNGDGIRSPGDPFISGIKIILTGTDNLGNIVLDSTWSDQDGNYIFSGHYPGLYKATVQLTQNYQTNVPFYDMMVATSGLVINQIDFPLYQLASIGDYIWFDENANGIQDSDEFGIDSITVTLSGETGGVQILETTLSDNGFYSYINLRPGVYTLHFSGAGELIPTIRITGNPEIDSDMDDAGNIVNVVLSSGQNTNSLDAGFTEVAKGSVGDYVWLDNNGNGIQDTLESGLENVNVFISGVETSGSIVNRSTLTDSQGHYIFENLRAGNYTVSFSLPQDYYFTQQGMGNGENDSRPDPSTGEANTFFLSAGEVNNRIDAGVFKKGSIGDFVWFDANENGLQDNNESGIDSFRLFLKEAVSGNLMQTVMSDSSGIYVFENVIPGQYYVEVMVPGDRFVTIFNVGDINLDSDFESNDTIIRTKDIMLLSGENRIHVDLGLIEKRTEIGGVLWRDTNANGVKESNEPVYVGNIIYLLNSNGDTLASSITDTLGAYFFGLLQEGLYKVLFPVFDSLTFTKFKEGNDITLDSDVLDRVNGIVNANLLGGERNNHLSAGYVFKSTAGDFVWLDENENGLQEINEIGINGIKVYLYNLSNILLDSTISNIKPGNGTSGYYQFQNIFPGDYYIRFNLPDNLLFTFHDENFPNLNSDVTNEFGLGTTDTLVIGFQEVVNVIDAGYFIDENALGEINGVVWQDVNANMTRESSDLLLDGVEVKLFDLDGDEIDITFTDDMGRYSFDNLFFGSYYVSIPDVQNRVFVLYNGSNVLNDSEITNEFGQGTSRILSLFPGDSLANFDLGYAPKISIGDFVWNDINYNGIQDAGESGVEDIVVELFNNIGEKIAATFTNASGFYIFDNLPAGRYSLRMIQPQNFLFTLVETGQGDKNSKANFNGIISEKEFLTEGVYTNMDAGIIREASIGKRLWLDLNGNGIFSENEPGIEGVVVELYNENNTLLATTRTGVLPDNNFIGAYQFDQLRPGNYYVKFNALPGYLISPANIGDTSTDSDITNTFGIGTTHTFSLGVGEIKNNIDGGIYNPACIGDLVWEDVNQNGNQDAGEPGIAGLLVSLYTGSGQLLDSVRTDLNGRYKFNNLKSRLYFIRVELKPGYQFTAAYNGNSSSTDSDFDETGTTPLISLAHGSVFLDVDAGMFLSPNRIVMGAIWNDANKNGLKENNESIMSGIVVKLVNDEEEELGQFVTNHAGLYCHQLVDEGNYFIEVIEKPNFKITQRGFHNQQVCNDFNENGKTDTINYISASPLQFRNGGLTYHPTTSVQGFVWKDENENNIFEPGTDTNMDNIVVLLFSSQNVFIKSTRTSSTGEYLLEGLDPGMYFVKIPTFTELTYILRSESSYSNITNEKGLGTSSLIFLDVSMPRLEFNFGYKPVPGLKELPENNSERNKFVVYPNPAMYNVHITLPLGVEEGKYKIINANGQIVRQGITRQQMTEIDVLDLPAGLYITELETPHQTFKTRFFRMEN